MAASIAKRSGSLLALLLLVGVGWLLWRTPEPETPEAPSPEVSPPAEADETELPAAPREAQGPLQDPAAPVPEESVGEAASEEADAKRVIRLQGTVIDSFDVPISEVIVSAYIGRERRDALTDVDGRFLFDDLRVGRYRLFVDQRTLTEGLLPPWRQSVPRAWSGEATGIHGTSIALSAGAEEEVDLRVHWAGSVQGRVAGPGGEPLAGAELRARSASGLELGGSTDERGRFRVEGAYPGSYLGLIELAGEAALEHAGRAPLPFVFDLAPGAELDLGEIAIEGGGPALAGRVVDQSGVPVAGLELYAKTTLDGVALRWVAMTDEEGLFRIGRLPAQSITLEVKRVADLFAQLPPPVDVDLSASPELLELPDWRVELQQRFSVHLRVEVDRVWLRDVGIVRYALEARELDGEEELVRRMIDPSSAELEWSGATPRAPFDLDVVLSNAAGEEHARRQRVIPVAGAREELVFRFP